ncbi:MAG: hypothetical protein R3E44_15640 [Paracoccaceae bacterium]
MRSILLVLPLVAATAACDTPQQTAFAGAATGAAIGAAVADGGDELQGAALGGAAGLAAGALIGEANKPGDCYYRDAYGRRYVAPCR